jgi:uncharacterized protein (TIGR03435 family)
MTKHLLLTILVVPFLAASAFAQAPLKFEVATIKAAAPGAVQNRMLLAAPNRVSIPSMTLTWLIYTAYGEGMNTSATVRGVPDSLKQTAYAVEGLAHEPSTQRQFQAMLRALLEERFALKIHAETQMGEVYALVVDRADGKLNPKTQAWDGTCASGQKPSEEDDPVYPRCFSGYMAPGLRLDGATMFSVAELLSLPQSRNLLGTIVQDKTGLTGRYKLELAYVFAPPFRGGQAPPDVAQPSLFTALREQWGLKLEKAQGPLKVFMVESAQAPTEN